MKIGRVLAKGLLAFSLFLACAGLVAGCGGSDAEKEIRDTVDTLTGKATVEASSRLKKQITDLESYQAEKVRQEAGRPAGEDAGSAEEGE